MWARRRSSRIRDLRATTHLLAALLSALLVENAALHAQVVGEPGRPAPLGELAEEPSATLRRRDHSGLFPFWSIDRFDDGSSKRVGLFGAIRSETRANGDGYSLVLPFYSHRSYVFDPEERGPVSSLAIYPLLYFHRRSPDHDHDVFPLLATWRAFDARDVLAWPLLHLAWSEDSSSSLPWPTFLGRERWASGVSSRAGIPYVLDLAQTSNDAAPLDSSDPTTLWQFGALFPWGRPATAGFPLARYRRSEDGGWHHHVFPLWAAGESGDQRSSYLVSPLYSTWREPAWSDDAPPLDRSSPGALDVDLPTRTEAAREEGVDRIVALPPLLSGWGSSPTRFDLHVLFPLARYLDAPGRRVRSLWPLYHDDTGRDSRLRMLSPLWWIHQSGESEETHVVPPLLARFHFTEERASIDVLWPLLEYDVGPKHKVRRAWPFYDDRWSEDDDGFASRSRAILPIWWETSDERSGESEHWILPLLGRVRESPDIRQIDLLGSLFRSEDSPDRSLVRFWPFFHDEARRVEGWRLRMLSPLWWIHERHDEELRQDWIVPLLGRIETAPDKTRIDLLASLARYHESEHRSTRSLWPLFHDDERRDERWRLRVWSPLWWIHDQFDEERRQDWIAPLLARVETAPETTRIDLLWPLVKYLETPERSVRSVWPLFHDDHLRDAAWRIRAWTPLWWRVDDEAEGRQEHWIAPVLGHIATDDERTAVDLFWPLGRYLETPDRSTRSVWPLYHDDEDRAQASRLRVLTPFWWIHDDLAEERQEQWIPPLIAHTSRAPDRHSFDLLWPLVHHARQDRPEGAEVSTRVLPFFERSSAPEESSFAIGGLLWRHSERRDPAVRSDWFLFPLGHSLREKNASTSWALPVWYRSERTSGNDSHQTTALLPLWWSHFATTSTHDGSVLRNDRAIAWPFFGWSTQEFADVGKRVESWHSLWPLVRSTRVSLLSTGAPRRREIHAPWPLVEYESEHGPDLPHASDANAMRWSFSFTPLVAFGDEPRRDWLRLYPLVASESGADGENGWVQWTSLLRWQAHDGRETPDVGPYRRFRVLPFLFDWEETEASRTVTGPLAWFRYRDSGDDGWFHLLPIGFGSWEGRRGQLGVFPFYFRRDFAESSLDTWPVGRALFLCSSLRSDREHHDSVLWKAVEYARATPASSQAGDYEFRVLHRLFVSRQTLGQRELLLNPIFRSFHDERTGEREFSIFKYLYSEIVENGVETTRLFHISIARRPVGET